MLARFRPTDARGRPREPATQQLVAREASLTKPTLVLWGAQDDTLPVSMAEVVAGRLPNATLRVIPDAKHSAHQERAHRVAELIRAFIAPRADAPRPAAASPAPNPSGTARAGNELPDPVIRRPSTGR